MKRTFMVTFIVLLFSATSVYAELHDRGGGLIYDDYFNITWLQDASYAVTTGVTQVGRMTWQDAMEWAENLVYYDSVRDTIYDDWRLPTTQNIIGTYPDFMNIPQIETEMGHMFLVDLGNDFMDNTTLNTNTGPFINMQDSQYWTSTPYNDPAFPGYIYTFYPYNGQTLINSFTYNGDPDPYNYTPSTPRNRMTAWAVRDGDVLPHVEYGLLGREYFPGITIGTTTYGAMFAGKVKNAEGIAVGQFNVITNHQGGPIEQCGATNVLVYFKLTMNFFDGRRLVLLMPYGDTTEANWDWDDATCPYGGRECDFYSVENLVPCESDVNPEVSLVADVSNIPLTKRQFGSRGFDEISGGVLNGWLIHTPPIFPAVIGTFVAN